MSLSALTENMFAKKPVAIFVGSDILMQLDACVSEDHGSDVNLTEHPVEDGGNIADHAFIQPISLTLQIVKSNHPLSFGKSMRNAGVGLLTSLPGVKNEAATAAIMAGMMAGGISLLDSDDQVKPDIAAFQVLQNVQFERKVCKIICELREYTNMLITSIKVPRDAATRQALIATVTFREIRVVKSGEEKIPVEYLKDGDSANGKKALGGATDEKKGGVATPKAATGAQSSAMRDGSILYRTFNR